jgi:hypothetical protein
VTVVAVVEDRKLWVVVEEMVDVRSDGEVEGVSAVGDGFSDVNIEVNIVVDPERSIV